MFKHECKITLSHARVKTHNDFNEILESNEEYIMHIGFRKINSNVLFSQIYGGTDKIKAIKKLKPSPHWYQASFYSPLIFDDSNFILFRKNDFNNYPCLIGSYLNSNLLQIILKRKILTGHPYRAKKKWCIIKFMFFTPEDAKYFIKNNIFLDE